MTVYSLTIVAIILAIALFLIARYFELKKVKEEKEGMMFNWVHGDLTIDIYIPLSAWARSISEVLLWGDSEKEYKEHFLLYTLSKSLKYRYMNRKIVGDDIFYTRSKSSNRYLSNLFDLIIVEISNILEKNISGDNRTEKRLIALQFLSKLGDCQNYMEFRLLLYGRDLHNKVLTDEVKTLRDNLSAENLMSTLNDQVDCYTHSIKLIFDEGIEYKWRRAKLYAYCCLFSDLMSYELYKMYDSWYEEREGIFNRGDMYNYVENVIYLIKQNENYYSEYVQLIDEMVDDIPDIQMNINNLKRAVKKIDHMINKTADISKKEELTADKNIIKSEIVKRKILENIDSIFTYTRNGDETDVGGCRVI